MLSMKHDLCRAQNNCSELQNLTLVISRYLGTGKIWATLGKKNFEISSKLEVLFRNSGLFLELRPEDHWCHHDSTFCCWVPSCLESTINPENGRLWWQSLMTKFAHEGSPCHLPVQVSATRWVQKCLVCCCIIYVICQGDTVCTVYWS